LTNLRKVLMERSPMNIELTPEFSPTTPNEA